MQEEAATVPHLDFNDPQKVAQYEEFIKTSQYGHFMQSLAWGQVKDNWQQDAVYLEADGTITAAMTIISVDNNGMAFAYAPRGPVCDLNDFGTVNQLLELATEVAQKRNAFLLRIDPEVIFDTELVTRLRENLSNDHLQIRTGGEGLDEHSFSNPRLNMVMEFGEQNYDEVFASISSKRRTRIRGTYKAGIETRRITKDSTDFAAAMDKFFELTQVMAQRQGITHRPKEYFERIFAAFEDVKFYEARLGEEVLASSIVLTYNRKAFYAYGASSNEHRNLNAPMQQMMEAIKDATEKPGVTEYDFGGIFSTDPSDGLYAFKSKFTGPQGVRELIGELDLVFDSERYAKFNG